MFATIITLLVAAIAIYLLKRQSDKEIAKPAPNRGLPPAGASGGNGEPQTTDKYSDGGSDPTRDPVTGEKLNG